MALKLLFAGFAWKNLGRKRLRTLLTLCGTEGTIDAFVGLVSFSRAFERAWMRWCTGIDLADLQQITLNTTLGDSAANQVKILRAAAETLMDLHHGKDRAMKLTSALAAAMVLLGTSSYAADTQAVLARARQHIETADYRATGKLVRVDASGSRTSYAVQIKGHWFPGVLRTLVDVTPPSGSAARAGGEERIRILLETRENGQPTIRIARLHSGGLTTLPFEKWSDGLFGGTFSYEDLLESQYYWQTQTVLKTVRFGARDCDVLKSAPGASDRTHYAEVETWLDHTIGYPIYAEKTLKESGTVKEFTSLGLRQTSGVWSANQVEAKTRGRAGATLLIIERGSAKAKLSAKDFAPEQISKFEDRP
jgi:hypothetical protein